MQQNYDFRIIVIDDNPEIHHDFIKILTHTSEPQTLDDLKKRLFDMPKENISLPSLQLIVPLKERKALT